MLQSRATASARTTTTSTSAASTIGTSRRALLLSAAAAALALAPPRPRDAAAAGATTPPESTDSPLVQALLAKSNAPGVRERRAKERLEAYNDKIYGEGYFDIEVGQGAARVRGITPETAAKIEAWQEAREQRLRRK